MPAPPPAPLSDSFVRRFWRGDVPLAFSYWGVGLPLIFVVALLLGIVSFVMHRQAFNPYEVVGALGIVWGTIILAFLFQSVGVWRSATRHRRIAATFGKLGIWGVAAQAVIVLSAGGLAYEVGRQGVPQLVEGWRMAVEGDPDIPPFSMRLMRDGTEAEITGGFKYGLARDAALLFAKAPNLRVVHLNSGGGRLGEAIELAKLIRARGLATYTSASCSSACTIAFVAGRDRYLKGGARIGFHRAVFAGAESSNEMRALLEAAHVEPAFVERAIDQPANTIWYPTEKELAAANVIMAVVDDNRYAASGLGLQPTLDDFKAALRRVPMFSAMQEASPKAFDDTAELYERRYFEGVPDGRIADEIRTTKFAPLLRARLVSAPDDLLIDYARLMADQFDALGTRDVEACFEFATRAADDTITQMLPDELRKREIDLSEKTLRDGTHRSLASAAEVRATSLALSEALVARFGVDKVRLLVEPAKVQPAQHALYCRLSAGMFRTIADLTPLQAGIEMSSIFAAMERMASAK